MVFAHDTVISLRALEDLVNTLPGREGEPDTLATRADLEDYLDSHDYTGSRTGDDEELADVQHLRDRLRTLVLAGRDEAADHINAMLAEAEALPQLVRHGGFDWHVHAVPSDASVARRIQVESAMAMMDVVRADEVSRLSTCDADDCQGVVIDLSRNRSRRFCSTACGNRIAVANYRARQSAG